MGRGAPGPGPLRRQTLPMSAAPSRQGDLSQDQEVGLPLPVTPISSQNRLNETSICRAVRENPGLLGLATATNQKRHLPDKVSSCQLAKTTTFRSPEMAQYPPIRAIVTCRIQPPTDKHTPSLQTCCLVLSVIERSADTSSAVGAAEQWEGRKEKVWVDDYDEAMAWQMVLMDVDGLPPTGR
ncbi:hypothetical protein Bbelb_168910 [Branchiostoma belcheri]|nr:hypothetical protein Bbelb_168910 [Branchiostoma belcheri]